MTGPADTEERPFLPALRFHALTPVFDSVVRVTTRERTFKERLLDQAAVAPGESVLDLGAGTGTLAIGLKTRVPGAEVTGLDADFEVLARARHKSAERGVQVEWVEGYSTELPFPDASFDVVISTLFFHHLTSADKRATLSEVARVLRPEGRLHVGDWGRPSDPAMALAFLTVRAFDGWDVTADNARGALPQLFEAAGLRGGTLRAQMRAPLGTLGLYAARKPAEPVVGSRAG
jgi:ubiquinone/menaquinone biosynthesis C-methylase UbiE